MTAEVILDLMKKSCLHNLMVAYIFIKFNQNGLINDCVTPQYINHKVTQSHIVYSMQKILRS